MTNKPKESAEAMYVKAKMIVLHPNIEDKIIGLMDSYAKQEVKKACRKQREICAKEAKLKHDSDEKAHFVCVDKDSIINAPEPQD